MNEGAAAIAVSDDDDWGWSGLTREPSSEMFDRSLDAFRRYQGGLYERLKAFKPLSELVYENADLNVRFQGINLYTVGAVTDTRAQLDRFWNSPDRVAISPPDSRSIDTESNDFVFGVVKRAVDAGMSFSQSFAVPQGYFVCCLGVGLGAHLNEIRQTTDCRHLLLVEPNLEFLYHSLSVFDWDDFFAEAEANDCVVGLMIETDPKVIADAFGARIRGDNPSALDGSYIFRHYENAAFVGAQAYLRKEIALSVAGLGFLTDEVLMIKNSFGNLVSGKSRVLVCNPAARREVPVFVVANGPSLDRAFEHLATIRDKAVIVAAGSALEPLLIHGIKPHFHVLMENSEETRPVYLRLFEKFDLSGVTLVASITVPPDVMDLYDDHILFFRPALSPTPAFAFDERQVLSGCDPAVSNAAFAYAVMMGFKNIYLVGNDLGKPVGGHHHSTFATIPPEDIEETRAYDREIRGNFGGVYYSDWFFNWVRIYTERLIAAYGNGRIYYNCSEGVSIKGSVPKRLSGVKLAVPAVSPEKVARDLVEEAPIYSRERLVETWTKLNFREAAREFIDALTQFVDEADSLVDGRYLRRCMTKLHPGRNIATLSTFYRGTIYQMLMSLNYYSLRLKDRGKEAEFRLIVRDEFRRSIDLLEHFAVELADQLEAEGGLSE